VPTPQSSMTAGRGSETTMPVTPPSSSFVIRQAWGHAAIYAIGSLFLGVGQIAIAPLLIRRLSLADLGTYELFVALYVAGRTILLLPLSSALVYGYCRLCETDEARKGIVGTAVLLAVGCSVCLCTIGLALPEWPSWVMQTGGDVDAVGRVVVFGLCLESVVQIGLASLRASQRPAMYGVIALVQLTSTLTLVGIFVGVWHWGVRGVFDAFFLGNVPAAMALLPALRGRVSLSFSRATARTLLVFAATLVPVNVAMLVLGISDRYFLRYAWGLPTVAVYALSYKLGSAAPQMVSMPFLLAWPAFVYAGTSTPRTGQLVSSAALYLWASGLFLVVTVSAAATPLIMLFGGAGFLAGVPVLPIVAVGGLLGGVMNIVMSAVVASGRFFWNMTALLIVAAILLGLNALLIPPYGMLGAAAATLLGYALGAVAAVVLARRLVVLDFQTFKWVKVSIAALVALLVGRELDHVSSWPLLSLCAASGVTAVVYGGLLLVSGVIPKGWWGVVRTARAGRSAGGSSG
jgi:O-antigen/teichoic acid export membrane protein